MRTLNTGRYETGRVEATLSPSMDIQVSSNFERLLFEAYGLDASAVGGLMNSLQQSGGFSVAAAPLAAIRAEFDAARVGETETSEEIARVWRETRRLIDPHNRCRRRRRARSLDRASQCACNRPRHGASGEIPAAIEGATGQHPPLPAHLADLETRPEYFDVLPNDQHAIENFIGERLQGSAASRRAAS